MRKLAFIFIVLFLAACSSSNTDISSQNSLTGKWNWISSSGGFTGKTISPVTEKKTIVIEFTKSTVKKYQNGSLVSETAFSIDNQASIFGGERKMIIPEDQSSKQSFEIKDNKLYLNDECHDCYSSEYERMK